MKKVEDLKPVTELFHCDVPGLDTDKIYLMNGSGINKNAGIPGVKIDIKQGEVPEKPIQIINVREGDVAPEVKYVNDFKLGTGSSTEIIICDHTLSNNHFVTESLTNILLEKEARLNILIMQNEHNQSYHTTAIKVIQEKGSFFSCTFVTLHGGTIENKLDVNLEGEGASCALKGLFLSDKEQRVINNLKVRHAVPSCYSRQLYKGILDDNAVGRFNGHIVVEKGAQKTEAYQSNHTIMLTHKAKMYTQPHLEIYADDVKCSHGATIGRIDENALFYLRSRGVGLAEARMLQQYAFTHDVINEIATIPLRDRISDLVEKRLRGELLPCANCSCHCF
jgi:Fe-S cluster assembly protein SufD